MGQGERRERLDDRGLFDPWLPAAAAPALARLAELADLVADKRTPEADRRAHAAAIRSALLALAPDLVEASPAPLEAQSPEHRRWFTEAVLLWTYFSEAGGRVLVDTHGSPTLAAFTPDLVAGPAERAVIGEALRATFGWSVAELGAIAAEVERRISNLRIKNAIAMRLHAELAGDATGLPARCLRLFQRLYGSLPFRAGDVGVTLTTTTLMIGLPFEHGALVSADDRPPAERAAIDAFLAKVEKYQNTFDTLRFPGFGLYDRQGVDPTLLGELGAAVAAALGHAVDARVVVETLATMVSLLPSQKAELFLVHDIWGHGWEESLCDFEWSYARLIELREPVHPASGPRFGGEAARTLREAFPVVGGTVTLDRAVLREVVAADLRGRVTVGLNVVVSECLADLIEHKYNRRRRAGAPLLPTSSLYPEAPTKLDLSLQDTVTLLKAAHRPYRRFVREPAERARFAAELGALGLPEPGRIQAVEAAAAAIAADFGPVLATDFTAPAPRDGRVPVNLAQRVMLGMVGLHGVITRFLDAADAASASGVPRWRSPASSIELLVVLLGWFYEQDRTVHFWHLDELLQGELAVTLQRFEAALHEATGAPVLA